MTSLPVAMVLVLLYYILYFYYSKKKAREPEEKCGKPSLPVTLLTSFLVRAASGDVTYTSGSTSSNTTWTVPIYYFQDQESQPSFICVLWISIFDGIFCFCFCFFVFFHFIIYLVARDNLELFVSGIEYIVWHFRELQTTRITVHKCTHPWWAKKTWSHI